MSPKPRAVIVAISFQREERFETQIEGRRAAKTEMGMTEGAIN